MKMSQRRQDSNFTQPKERSLFGFNVHSFLIFYKSIEAEIREILEFLKNKPEAEILRRI